VVYSPYQDSGACKSASAVISDFQTLASAGYQTVRIYGTDCDQVSSCLQASAATGLQLFLGVFDMGSVDSELQTIISTCSSSWSSIVAVGIGNEQVNSGGQSASTMVSLCNSSRQTLRAAGYSGPVVTVDTFNAILAHPELGQCSDFVAANAHAYFDGSVSASSAGSWVAQQVSALSSACGGKTVIITESGWPSQGSTNGAAVPSKANQQAAVSSIKAAVPSNCFLFTAWNDIWKGSVSEQYWGFLSSS